MSEVFHKGELEVQKKADKEIEAKAVGKAAIKDTITPMAINFLEQQYLIIVSSMDLEGKIWASPVFGLEGFIKILDEQKVLLDRTKIISSKDDILYKNLLTTPHLGLVFIDHGTRKRFRINGKLSKFNNDLIELKVKEAYGNCPKYIQQRAPFLQTQSNKGTSNIVVQNQLNDQNRYWIENADTLYIGSVGTDFKMDASHRGGNKGFIEIQEDHTLRIPDYVGNNMYNTLGNIAVNPTVGLLFINYEKGNILQLTGKASIEYNQNSAMEMEKSMGTGMFWTFKTESVIFTEKHHPITWEQLSPSPFNP